MNGDGPGWIRPDGPLPGRVRVISTLRGGGVSTGPYASLNLAAHVGDRPEHVLANRQRLRVAAELPAEPLWLEQVHGIDVARHSDVAASPPRADASVAFGPGQVCAVMTADCLPVVLADRDGRRVAVAHAGWRGLLDGVLQATLAALDVPGGEVWAWLGPAIGPRAFEVGAEVRDAYATRIAGSEACFERNERGRYQADLYGLATRVLEAAGVEAISGGGWCTHTMQDQYYSFRREGTTGRMATLAWLA